MARERLVIFLPLSTVSPIIRTFTGFNFFVEVLYLTLAVKLYFCSVFQTAKILR